MSVSVTLPFNLTNGTTADATQVMANYNAIVTALASSAAASGANSDITSLTGLTTALTPAVGGTPVFFGGASAGTAAAQVVTPTTPNTFTLIRNYTVIFTASFSSTGPTTLAVNGTAATNLLKQTSTGLQPLNANDILAGQIVVATYDGTQFQLINAIDVNALMPASTLAGNPTGAAAPGIPITIGGGLSFSGTVLSSSAFVPNVQVFLSGTGATYTTPTNGGALPLYLRVRMIGGGGGGGASNTNAGSNGGDTSFAGWTALHGGGGATASGSGGAGGTGGVNGSGTPITRVAGGSGTTGAQPTAGNTASGAGGNGFFGGAAGGGVSSVAGVNAATNSGSGGSGAVQGGSSTGGSGGGAGEYVEFIIASPAASYTYTVGTAGAGGVAGGQAGGNGGAGRIEVMAHWQ